jgi:CubicO group peptidase (beta-lactamase class C family)
VSPPAIHGEVAAGFEPVRSTFEANFREAGEVGAAVAVYLEGIPVVDLWGGVRDVASGAPWERDTHVIVFSTTKGLSALPVAMLADRGVLDYDAPIAEYWPEFARHGKERITVRQLLSHQAGLCALDRPITVELLGDLDALAEVLADQRPAWEPGEAQGYHGLTIGWYEGELVRRLDPQGRTLGRYLQEEVCTPLDVDFHVGYPDDVAEDHRATLVDYDLLGSLHHAVKSLPWRFIGGVLVPWGLPYRTLRNPAIKRLGDWNQRDFLSVEIPAGNGVGTVRSIARAYGDLSIGAPTLGLGAETLRALADPATPPPAGPYDRVLHLKTLFSLGFGKPKDEHTWGTSPRAFGSFGAGGSFGFADPDQGLGYAYAPNKMGFHIWNDPRERRLREAVYACLRAGARAPANPQEAA